MRMAIVWDPGMNSFKGGRVIDAVAIFTSFAALAQLPRTLALARDSDPFAEIRL